MPNAMEIITYCERQYRYLQKRADTLEANRVPATLLRAMATTYGDVMDFIARQEKKSLSVGTENDSYKKLFTTTL